MSKLIKTYHDYIIFQLKKFQDIIFERLAIIYTGKNGEKAQIKVKKLMANTAPSGSAEGSYSTVNSQRDTIPKVLSEQIRPAGRAKEEKWDIQNQFSYVRRSRLCTRQHHKLMDLRSHHGPSNRDLL